MKINAINKINFKGLFIDKSNENKGNWLMEYRPYSWELENNLKHAEAPQTEWDIYSSKLPDNEKKFTDYTGGLPEEECKSGNKFSHDILGTKFYDVNYSRDYRKEKITVGEAMNREESLKVYNKKLKVFMQMKKDLMKTQTEILPNSMEKVEKMTELFDERSSDLKKSYLARSYAIESSSRKMDEQFNGVKSLAINTINGFQNYVKLNNSLNDVQKLYNKNQAEIQLLESSRKSGNLIDISVRGKFDPNKSLWDALQDLKSAVGKIIALPHKTIAVKELMEMIGRNIKESQIANEGIKIIDQMIHHRV